MFKEQSLSLDKALACGTLPPLETFTAPYDTESSQTGVIRISFPEFTCVCPRTGYPDFARITVLYLPDRLCLELKSWKLYLNAFRMVGAFHEKITAHLFNTVTGLLKPRWAMLIGEFSPRGNVDTRIVFETDTPRPGSVDILLPGEE